MKTVKQLQDEIRAQVWPSGEAENLKISPVDGVLSAHDAHFQEAFADIAKWCPCEQDGNINIIEFCKTSFRCGLTIVPAPRGNVFRVGTVIGDNFCDEIWYRQVSREEVECQGKHVLREVGTLPSVPDLPLGYSSANSSTDSPHGRARAGVWAIERGNIYIFPWIQSVEKVVIEWDGIKTEWALGDLVNPDQDYKKAVKLYWQHAHERDFGASGRAAEFKMGVPPGSGGYDQALAELIWQCHQRNKVRESHGCRGPSRKFQDKGLPVTAADLVLAHIGGINNNAAGNAVAAIAIAWAPRAIVASVRGSADFDALVGSNFHGYLHPYYGTHGDGAPDENAFWPCPGELTYTDGAGIDAYLAFFPLPEPRRYYEVCIGLVHVFSVDTFLDGGELVESDAQGQWLRAKLLLSPARWKVVLMDQPNWGGGGANLPLKSWGADLVLAGAGNQGSYERVLIAGLNGISNGMGGYLSGGSNPASSGQVFFQNNKFGAGKLTAVQGSLKYEFIDVTGTAIDSVEVTK